MSAFQVLPFTPENLFQSLANDVLSPIVVSDHDRAKYLYCYLNDIKTNTIVIEVDYTDADYLDDFASYYVKCHQFYKHRCKRLHFFSHAFDEHQFRRFVREELAADQESAFVANYLGFVVARPLPDAIIGRTILKTYESDGGRRYYPATREYKAHLFGHELPLRSLAFQEQDSVLAACATVALWSAFHKTAELFGTPILTPVEITRVANQIHAPGRPVPSHGLDLHQICNSVRNVGLEPEVIQVRPHTPLVSLIYGHLRMGLPVVLLVSIEGLEVGHAITLAGYSLRNSRVRTAEVASGNCVPLPGLRIDKFYAHDDQFGPFGRVQVQPSASLSGPQQMTFPVVFHGAWSDPNTGQPRKLYPIVALIPVYHKIRVTFLDALQWLTRLDSVLSSLPPGSGTTLNFDWDLYLTTTNEYKASLKTSPLSKDRVEELLLHSHPRFIWRASLTINGTPAVELLIDATDMARSFPVYRVLWYEPTVYDAVSALLNAPPNQTMLAKGLTPRFFDLLKNAPAP